MATVKFTDNFGFVGDVEFPEGLGILRYIRDLRGLKISDLNLAALQQIPLDKVPVKNASGGLSFEQPVSIGINQVEMTVKAEGSGRLQLVSPKDKQLFDPELFGEPIPVGADQFYVSLGVTASVSTSLSREVRDLGFGFDSGGEVSLAVYRLFTKTGAGGGSFPPFVQAIQETAKSFVILGDLEDLAGMSEGMVATIEGKGSLKFSGEAELLSVVNPLVSIDLPTPAGELQVVSGNSIKVGASFELFGSYQIRAQKLDAKRVRLGFYKKRGSEFTLKVAAKGGVSAGVGETDFLGQLLKAVSKNPEVDKQQLAAGGLGKEQVAAIEEAVKAGIQRKLELALNFELSETNSSEAAFDYEIDLGKLKEDGRQAIHNALDGDLSALVQNEAALPAGLTLRRSIFTETKKKKQTFKLNLLGIYNFISISTLTLKGKVLFVPETGELVITDRATASRIAASTSNFAADHAKLRKVLAESFLVTAAYSCSKLAAPSQKLEISHTYFELNSKTNGATMKNNLDVVETLGLMKKQEKDKLLAGRNNFGSTTLYAEAQYDDALATRLFLNPDGTPRSEAEYEKAGRAAIESLVQAGEPDDYRRLPMTDNALWQELTQLGNPHNFKTLDKIKQLKLAKKLPMEIIVGGISTDYLVVRWWASEMRQLGEKLAEVRNFLKDNPKIDPENNDFKALRRGLAEHLKKVAGRTKEQFGDPWGLAAMDLATGRAAKAKVQVTGQRVAFVRERETA
ncbi:MAG TPA: hypothetical protein VGO96_19625 [Pyrinomonadaceae bacterium]|jgi:hypothetical protein|nr:hypothetical protein [Pyrinomonadaceae bacterium]